MLSFTETVLEIDQVWFKCLDFLVPLVEDRIEIELTEIDADNFVSGFTSSVFVATRYFPTKRLVVRVTTKN